MTRGRSQPLPPEEGGRASSVYEELGGNGSAAELTDAQREAMRRAGLSLSPNTVPQKPPVEGLGRIADGIPPDALGALRAIRAALQEQADAHIAADPTRTPAERGALLRARRDRRSRRAD